MCTVLVAWRCVRGAPLLLAANRDELLRRPSAPPAVLREQPRTAGGRDLLAGGTWLAVAAGGRLAAVTNRWVGEAPRDPAKRSRGELPLLVLEAKDDDAASAAVAAVHGADYNPVNLLYASAGRTVIAHVDPGRPARTVELEPGPHALTTGDVDDTRLSKVAALSAGLSALLAQHGASPTATLDAMEALLRGHGPDGAAGIDAPCIHGEEYGTVSASSVLVADDGEVTYRHADGRPCEHPHLDVSALLR